MRHQRTDLPPRNAKSKQKSHKSKSKSHKRYLGEHTNQRPPHKPRFDPSQAHQRRDRCSMCGDSKHVEGFKCPARKFQCETCNKYGHFTSLCFKKKISFKSRNPKAHQLQVGVVYAQEDFICRQSSDLTSSDESLCLQVKIQHTQTESKFSTPHHLITNLNHNYQLKPYHKRLDTCADVSIMPASVYKLVFKDPDCKKLAPGELEIGMHTTDTVKLVGSCVFYLLHPDTKHIQEVTFYVVSNNGSVLLSCTTTLELGLIQPCSRFDYLPPRASLITSSADHPEKTKSKINVHVSRQESTVPTMSNCKGKIPKLVTSKGEILVAYSDVFDGIGCFQRSPLPYHVH